MIGTLIRKDLILNRSQFIWLGIIVIGFSVYLGVAKVLVTAGMAFSAFVCSLLPTMMSGREDRFHSLGFICSLPVTRRQIVTARYLITLAQFPAFVFLFSIVIWPFSFPRFPVEILLPFTLLAVFTAYTIGVSLAFPLVLRFGFMGLLFGLVAAQVVGTLMLALGSRGGILGIERIFRGIGSTMGQLRALLGDAPYFLLVLAALGALWAGSYAVALALFTRKEI
jgi:hypothetical protein